MLRARILLAAAMLIPAFLTSGADAGYYPYYGPGFGLWNPYNSYINGRPPYFAEFPPVYYSYPTARTYGQYPYAYMPGAPSSGYAPQVTYSKPKPKPLTIQNQYVDRAANSARQIARQEVKPLRILNPFVEQEGPRNARLESGAER